MFTNNSDVKNFSGVNINKTNKGLYLAQPYLIVRILETVGLSTEELFKRQTKENFVVKPLLLKDTNGSLRTLPWNYCSVIRMLNYLSRSIQLDIAIAIHQVARFSTDPKNAMKKLLYA